MMGLVSGVEYAIFGLGIFGCVAYAVIATIVHLFGKK